MMREAWEMGSVGFILEKRVPPQNIEAEQAVLGVRLIDWEQDADIVTFLYRENYYKPDTENKHTELIIAKHRNGPFDTVNLFLYKKCTKFVGFSKRDEAC